MLILLHLQYTCTFNFRICYALYCTTANFCGSLQRPNMTGPKGANTEGPKGATTDGPSVTGCAFLLWATGGCLQWAPCGRHIGSLVGQYMWGG